MTRTRVLGGAAVLAIAGLMLATGNGLPGETDVDTSERRKWTLIADAHNHRAIIDAIVKSNVRGVVLALDGELLVTTWKRDVWAETGEVLSLDLEVRTHGNHGLGIAPWARCQIIPANNPSAADIEIDQRRLVKYVADMSRQAYAGCTVAAG